MKYETPELTALNLAIDAIQGSVNKRPNTPGDFHDDEGIGAYQDWE